MRLLYFLLIFLVGKTFGNFPITEYNNPLSAQLMNTLLTVANTKGLFPDVLSSPRPVWQQIEQNFPTFQEYPTVVNPIFNPELISYQSNLLPTQIQPIPQLLSRPNLLSAQLPSLEIYPQNVQVQTIPLRQDCSQNTPILNTQYLTNRFFPYDSGVNDVNCQTNVFGTLELIDVPDVGFINVENPPRIPYNIEINLPILTSKIPDSPSYIEPYPLPPIIIQESSKSSIWKWLPLLVGLLSRDNNNCNNCCNCNNGCNCNNCCGCCNCRMPCPFNFPIINNGVTSGAA